MIIPEVLDGLDSLWSVLLLLLRLVVGIVTTGTVVLVVVAAEVLMGVVEVEPMMGTLVVMIVTGDRMTGDSVIGRIMGSEDGGAGRGTTGKL
jgi:hypothetical protein